MALLVTCELHDTRVTKHAAIVLSLCPEVFLAMAFVGPLQKMRGTKRKVVCVLCKVDDSSEEDVWDKEKETCIVYETRVNARIDATWPLGDFQRSSQYH